MANTVKRKKRRKSTGRNKKAKVNVIIKEKAQIIQKNDKIRVQQPDTIKKVQGRPPASVAPVFRVKIKKKKE